MTISFHALSLLCAVAAVVFAASTRRVPDLGLFATGYAAAVLLTGPARLPDPVVAGALAAGAAALSLFGRPEALSRALAAVAAGAVVGMWPALLEVQGVPQLAAIAATVAVAATTAWLARNRPRFAPDHLRDEALLIAGLLGAVVAAMPGVLDGWQAARNLNVTAETAAAVALPAWTLGVVGGAMAIGAAYSVWSRR